MLNLLEDVVSRAEQSRFSYTLQTEEFRQLNSNLQTYLNNIKTIDDENRQLQEKIEQIRTNYIRTLENHLKRLPEDFRQESYILTEAHIERYKSKSRAKRFINEREELKKRINFVLNNEKEQLKHLNNLQKQERFVKNEFQNLNEQIQHLYHYVRTEKQTHQRAMTKVDDLQIQLEQICIERSKTEFEIQTLREEVKLMQTAKEFLDEEHQTILSTQTEANEYLLSRLNDSISRIREDFDELNKTQLKQIENEYKQMMKILEDKSLSNKTIDETMINQQRTIQIEYEKLQNEYQTLTQELTTLNDHNEILSETILNMEADLYSIRDQYVEELIIKDNEFQRNQIELHTLNEKLNHLSEYDRNLKFELTLYRGVLESEYRRKQQQLINNQQQQPIRPTTLRTTLIRSHKNSSILTNRNHLEPIIEKINTHIDEEKIENKDECDSQDKNVTTQEQHQTSTETSKSPISTVPADQVSSTISPTNQKSSTPPTNLDYQISSETRNVSTSPTNSTLPEDQSASSDTNQSQSLTTSLEIQNLSESSPANEETLVANTSPVLSEDRQTSTDTQKLSSIPPSTNSEIPSEVQESSTTPAVFEDQPQPSEVHQSSPMQQEDRQESSEVQELSTNSPKDEQILSETENSSTSPMNLSSSTLPDNHQTVSDVQQSSNILSNEQPMLPESSSMPSPKDQSISSEIQQKASRSSQEQPTLSEIQQSPTIDENVQEQPSSITTDEHQTTTSVSDDTSTNPTKEISGENQLLDISNGHDNLIVHEETTNSSTHETEEVVNDRHQSIEPLTAREHETNQTENNESTKEEQVSSSNQNQFDKNSEIGYTSLPGYFGSINDSIHVINQEQSLTDVEDDIIGEAGLNFSPKIKEKEFLDPNESNLEATMQDLRYVYRSLINNDELVEINDDFSDNLIDRLEFGDNFIRILFDGFLRKYIIQPAKTESHSKTLDWIEFRDILFPIVTGHYMEEHIRKIFGLFNINKNGYLSKEEITELLELLQVNNSNELELNGELNVDELIETIKKTDHMSNNILSEEIKNRQWYIQNPIDEENIDTQSISSEIPNINYPSKINNEIILLSRIFKRVGADFENKQLDSNNVMLSMKLTNEFIHNNIHISNDDLQLFIELYLNKKQNTDILKINWIEFRDIFFPIINNGMVTKDDITRWFDILDINHNKTISREQILHLLRLLQVFNPEEIFNKIQEIYPNNNNSWTLEELIFALENLDETKTLLLSTNEQITSFDLEWLTKNIF